MKKNKSIYKYYLFITLVLSSCSPSKAQLKEVQLKKENENLLISFNASTVVLKNVLAEEANGYFKEGRNGSFYIIYEYYASFNKSMIIYSCFFNIRNIHVNKIIHFNYNDREGIPYGWIYYCNKKMLFDEVDYDKLTEIKSQMGYSCFTKSIDKCSVEIKSSKKTVRSIAVKNDEGIKLVIPLFYEDGSCIGEGVFQYKSDNWSDLSMSFPINKMEKNYFIFNKDIDAKNVVFFNNIAYYLERGKNYNESIYLLKKILDRFPNRTVAYINLGDAYWGLNKIEEAKQAYFKYIELMKRDGKESKIPQRILDRTRDQ
ncbi:tetratricopeptide repeat protein [Saccharicrinis fermentans]|uniref:Uncharacterized protein n=1 Tax=Saccharicrinis fermentans DSM 9555 = JCM 21142 TaxID=869213 RepID=W7YM58_9BACT|nr:tetratricopeptide repeat protein [Saccharicrinis fermentans]GAF05756.1 hypothetical protein JCM21142_104508 [Saccharicrinis fermentans DSM 9555 = JCM 21142]